MRIILVGNPNCGKTTLFNALTGDKQRIGNWPGVTVEKKTGTFNLDKKPIEVIDLPGVYSIVAHSQGLSQDERIAAEAIVSIEADCIVNIIDACHLERHLYLTSQLLELGKPMIIALNMMDIAKQRGISISIQALEQELGCPVIPIQAHKMIGVEVLRQALLHLPSPATPWTLSLPLSVLEQLSHLEQQFISQGQSKASAYYHSLRAAEGSEATLDDQETDIIIADARYQRIHDLISLVQHKRSDSSEHFTAAVDKIVLHRYLALPIFFALMYLMFWFAINCGGAFQDFFDISTDILFVQGSAWLLHQIHAPNWVIAIIANGVGKGINTVVSFIPVIASMFFFLSLLEASGYMARAAFVVDKIMRIMGLPGKSFVPMIVGFGCNVPAIMAARTLDSERDRLLTVMMSPFMSCSARLAIYAVFVAAFFPTKGQNIVFSLYLAGIVMAVLTGFLLRHTLLKGQTSPLIIELPAYHKPELRRLLRDTGIRLKIFVFRAGKLIIPVCVLLGGLNALTLGGGINASEGSTQSLLSLLGQWITPLFSPMGIDQANWPATVGLLTGMLAKEVVIGTLNSLYGEMGHVNQMMALPFDFWSGIQMALHSIPNNLAQLGSSIVHPMLTVEAGDQLSKPIYGMMVSKFHGQIGAYAYLLFVLLYIPCVSTMAVIRQEANKQMMWLSIVWSFAIAYVAAVVFYQGAKCVEQMNHIRGLQLLLFGFIILLSLFYYKPKKNTGVQRVTPNT